MNYDDDLKSYQYTDHYLKIKASKSAWFWKDWYSNILVDFLHPWKMIMDEYKMNVISPYLSNSKLIRMLRWAVTRLLESKKVYFVLQYERSV